MERKLMMGERETGKDKDVNEGFTGCDQNSWDDE